MFIAFPTCLNHDIISCKCDSDVATGSITGSIKALFTGIAPIVYKHMHDVCVI